MTFKELYLKEHPCTESSDFDSGILLNLCPSSLKYADENNRDKCSAYSINGCKKCWNREIPEDKLIELGYEPTSDIYHRVVDTDIAHMWPDMKLTEKPRILDSGNRREFESGAVRDIQEGKGRCDLLPLDVIGCFYLRSGHCREAEILIFINEFTKHGDVHSLNTVLDHACFIFDETGSYSTMLLEVAKHFEEGCKKYGENNWRKGIPAHCYIDSAVRHYLKHLRGDRDEPHDRAFCWNIMCCIWTCKNKPELNDYAKRNEESEASDT